MVGMKRSLNFAGIYIYEWSKKNNRTYFYRIGDRHIKVGRRSEGYSEADADAEKNKVKHGRKCCTPYSLVNIKIQ